MVRARAHDQREDGQGHGPDDPTVARAQSGPGPPVTRPTIACQVTLAAILTVCLLSTAWQADGQQPAKAARIGILSSDAGAAPHPIQAFRQGLRDLGWVEGRNVVIEQRDAGGKLDRLPRRQWALEREESRT